MKAIVCVDDNLGISFNHRRQSKDRMTDADILKMCRGSRLYMSAYTRKRFSEAEDNPDIIVTENFKDIDDDDYAFMELEDPKMFEDSISELIVYHWNTTYPADTYMTIDLKNWFLMFTEDIKGYSHPKITKEVYKNRGKN